MKIPFVSRKKYDTLQRALDRLCNSLDNHRTVIHCDHEKLTGLTFVNAILIGNNASIMDCKFIGTRGQAAFTVETVQTPTKENTK
jgi:hypothetical protein